VTLLSFLVVLGRSNGKKLISCHDQTIIAALKHSIEQVLTDPIQTLSKTSLTRCGFSPLYNNLKDLKQLSKALSLLWLQIVQLSK
jgi:hypothetical protein